MKNKNLLAENMLRFRAKNLSEIAKRKIVKLAEIITEQDDSGNTANLGELLNRLNLKDGSYKLEDELANVNIFMSKPMRKMGADSGTTMSDNQPAFSGAYAKPLYVLKYKTMFFIGKSMSGGPDAWTANPGWKLVKPSINPENGNVTRNGLQETPLNTRSAKSAYIQIYNASVQGYRNTQEITNLVRLLEIDNIIPSLQAELKPVEYNAFLQHNHDSVINMINKK